MYSKRLESLLNRIKCLESCILEGKQVGDIYHVCTVDSYLKYIKPRDILSSSGRYMHWLHNGETDWVSFTRNQIFVVETDDVFYGDVLLQIVIDGDALSEHYKITPYNDFAYDKYGNKNGELDRPERREAEEAVKGPIKNVSRYIKEIRFDVRTLDDKTIEIIKSKIKNEPFKYFNFIKNKKDGSNRLLKQSGVTNSMSVKQFLSAIDNDAVKSGMHAKNVSNIMLQMDKYIDNLDYNSINDILSNVSCREYFQKYGHRWMNKLLDSYLSVFNERNGKCENQDVIKTFKAILDNGIDVTKFSYSDNYGNMCDIFKALPKYGGTFDKKESELAKLIKQYI